MQASTRPVRAERLLSFPTVSAPLFDLLPDTDADTDELLGRFLDYVATLGLQLYPAQEEAILALFEATTSS